MDYYKNKLVLITGGSSGLGLALAKQLADQEANVWILARHPEAMQTALKGIESHRKNVGQKFGCIQADVTDEEELSRNLDRFIADEGVPDIVINSAGSSHPGLLTEQENEIFHQMMDLNFYGTVYVTKKVLPGMIQRRSGHIVNISSIAGFAGVLGYAAYSSSKFAVRGFSEVIRPELKEYGIRVSCVYPPGMHTPGLEVENRYKPLLTRVMEEDNDPIVEPDIVARAVLKDVARGQFNIRPNSSSRFFFFIYGFLGMTLNLFDTIYDNFYVNPARRKIEKQNGNLKQKLEMKNERREGNDARKES
jgi:3-dehydrosphinganine reductase